MGDNVMEEPEWYVGVGKHGEPVKCYKGSFSTYFYKQPPMEFKPLEIIRKLEELEKRIQSLEADRKRNQD